MEKPARIYIGFEKYFMHIYIYIYFQMNCSIQLEHAGFFSFVSIDGMTWKFVFRWAAEFCLRAGLHGRPRNMSLVLDHDSPSQDQWKSRYMALKNISYISKNECSIQLERMLDHGISSFVSMGCFDMLRNNSC